MTTILLALWHAVRRFFSLPDDACLCGKADGVGPPWYPTSGIHTTTEHRGKA